jgi:hypothetical protein
VQALAVAPLEALPSLSHFCAIWRSAC